MPGQFSFTAPASGEYAIEALGGSGGNSFSFSGGLGAEVSGDIALTAGEALTLYVGRQGESNAVGGGRFVFLGATVFAVAGAGYSGGGAGPGLTGTSGGTGAGATGGAGARAEMAPLGAPPTPFSKRALTAAARAF
jgi:Glycine rich protein